MIVDDSATVKTLGAFSQPLLVVMHGYGAHERDLTPLLPHLGHHGPAAFLRAPIPLGPGSWAWFPLTIGDTDGELGTRVEDVEAATSALVGWLERNAAGREVVLLGFSQGGALAIQVLRDLAARADDGVAAFRVRCAVVLSGFVAGADDATLATPDASLAALAPEERTPVFFGHGGADPIVPPGMTACASSWLAQHTALTERAYPGLVHGIDGRELDDVRAFLAAHGG